MSKYERLSRLLKITILVRTRRNVTRGELARELEVSVRTVQRDIKTLCYAGVPIFWTGDRYEIMQGFFLPALNLNLEEAFRLTIAIKAFSEGKLESEKKILESAMSKVIAGLPDEICNSLIELIEGDHTKFPYTSI